MPRITDQDPKSSPVGTCRDEIGLKSVTGELERMELRERRPRAHEAGGVVAGFGKADQPRHLREERTLDHREDRRDLEGGVGRVERSPEPVAHNAERIGPRVVLIQEVGMVGLNGAPHHQVGRLDEIGRLGWRLVVGELETDRAGEVGGQVGGAGPPDDRLVAAGRAGDVAEGPGGDRLDRIDRRRRTKIQEIETVSGEESVDEGERKTDDPVRAALDAVGEQARRALEAVGARLVVGIARVDVPREPLLADLADHHLRDIHGAVHEGIAIGTDKGNGDTGEDLVGSGGEGPQHRSGLVTIRGFAEDHPVERDGRIGSEHDTGGTERSHGFRSREPLDIVARRLIVQGCLVDGSGLDARVHSNSAQELSSTGGA